jgi:hypothetical protein
MSNFIEQLKLAEKAAEDIYFAKVNRELIKSIRIQMQAETNRFQCFDQSVTEVRPQDSKTQ